MHNILHQQHKKKLQKQLQNAKAKIEKLNQEAEREDHTIEFEQLGIDKLYIDESHLFKNLEFITKIKDIQNSSSQKATDLYGKILYLNEITNNKGVVFASGTPISNTIGELYTSGSSNM
ncbi:MAG: hypothetical protein Q4F88_01520 [Eubacteriales bacterium]|nr:hypothetical protein [Eubacteriales bacterium]